MKKTCIKYIWQTPTNRVNDFWLNNLSTFHLHVIKWHYARIQLDEYWFCEHDLVASKSLDSM